jgi:hypothetical protein
MMKPTFALLTLCLLPAAAQENNVSQMKLQLRELVADPPVMLGVKGAVMGPSVKGAPYSALETVENTQTLGDGTHINQTSLTMVYRDSEGRLRRETPDLITIWDPVANVSYSLNPKTQTAMKLPLGLGAVAQVMNEQRGPNGQVMRFVYHAAGVATATAGALPLPPLPPPGGAPTGDTFFLSTGAMPGLSAMQVKLNSKSEPLGQQLIETVNAEGTRTTATIDVGQIGNDRPIQIVTERWYSRELEIAVKMTHSDPRTGQETLQLTNISRVEPTPDLFQVPAGYQIQGK